MFERVIYTSLWIIILAIIGVGGWLAYSKLNHDFVYESDRFDQDTKPEEPLLTFDEPDGPAIGDPVEVDPAQTTDEPETPDEPVVVDPAPASGQHAGLAAELQKLITDNIHMKVGSRGTRVGTVQKFLNVFSDSSSTVDNDFGNGTKAKVVEFQTAVGITADGEPGPQTYRAMVEWLEEN